MTSANQLAPMVITAFIISLLFLLSVESSAASSGKIVFSRKNSGETYQIYSMNPDGSDIKQLTSNGNNNLDARISPDGAKIVWHNYNTIFHNIYMMDIDGNNSHKIRYGYSAAFSPDGSKLAISDRDSSYDDDIFIYDLNTSISNKLYNNNLGFIIEIDWSPDGKKIAFTWQYSLFGGDKRLIKQINTEGDPNPIAYTPENGDMAWEKLSYAGGPRYSPDSKKLIYFYKYIPTSSSTWNIYIMNIDGSNKKMISDGSSIMWPVWSPNGSEILVQKNAQIYTMDTNGKIKNRLTSSNALEDHPTDWRDPNAVIIPTDTTVTAALTASPTTVNYQGSTTLNWSSSNASYCSATTSDGWSGEVALSGNVSIAPIATTTIILSCTGNAGSSSQSVTVTVNSSADCLFNWAEANYPGLFSPAGAGSLDSSPYTYRYYKDTNSYVGVSSGNNHVYYLGSDNVLQDVGGLPGWLATAGCK